MKRALLLLGLAGGSTLPTAGCASVIPEPTMEMAGGDAGVFDALRAGRSLYVNKCSGCHSLLAPESHSDVEWTREVDEMVRKKKVRLALEDHVLLLRFLTASNGRD